MISPVYNAVFLWPTDSESTTPCALGTSHPDHNIDLFRDKVAKPPGVDSRGLHFVGRSSGVAIGSSTVLSFVYFVCFFVSRNVVWGSSTWLLADCSCTGRPSSKNLSAQVMGIWFGVEHSEVGGSV
mmetsp:Transcript_166180/g.533438  ORF Transcript_166180/g.533438 Transcript_166180/m.533438 type:complete len:126 (+) Transcript_166180:3073-3450(+)